MTIDPPRDLEAAFRVAAAQLARAKDDKGAEQLRRWGARANAAPAAVLDELLAVARRLRRPIHCTLLRAFTDDERAAAIARAPAAP